MRSTPVKLAGNPGLLLRPDTATWLYLLCHGAGAGMRHRFMTEVATALAARSIATLRWELPYMAAGRARPDPPAVCEAAVRTVCAAAATRWPELRRVAGGKSFGGRMTSGAAATGDLPIEGVVFLGFPLHPANQPATTRADHLARVARPLLFVQGTRDDLADLALLRPIVAGLARATLVEIAHADHGFEVPRRSGRTQAAPRGRAARPGIGTEAPASPSQAEVISQVADTVAGWLATLPARPQP